MAGERKIMKAIIDANELPDFAARALTALCGEEGLMIKGGCAKAVLEWFLMKNGKIPLTKSLKALMDNETDLDIIFIFRAAEEKDKLKNKFNSLKEKLAGAKIELKANDIELVRNKKFLSEEKIVEKIFGTRDLTINEVLLLPAAEKGKWALYCSDVCLRDTLNGVGIITGNTKATVWYNYGRLVPTNYGLFRILRILIERKVKKIYLPQWWVDVNLEEAKKKGHTKFGAYGAILGRRYIDKPRQQETMMKYLYDLGIEKDITRFDEYIKEQEAEFQNQSNFSFEMKEDFSFEDMLEHSQKKEEKRLHSRQERKKIREECDHYIEKMACNHCRMSCQINYCIKCKFVQVIPGGQDKEADSFRYLLCNYNWRHASVYWDKNGFFPRENKAGDFFKN